MVIRRYISDTQMHYLYHIENQINGKIYVGKSMEREDSRWQEHLADARSGRTKMPIHRAIKKYGSDNFSYNITSMYDTQEEALLAEVDLIAYLKSQDVELYNLTAGGEGVSFRRGPRSAEHQKNAHKFPKGNIPTNKGKEISENVRAKIALKVSNRKISDLQRQEIKELYMSGKYKQKEISLIYGVGPDAISRIVSNKTGWVARGRKNAKISRSY